MDERRALAPASLPLGFAHRGGPLRRREQNTLVAFERAVRLGAGVESDVRLTGDGEVVLIHAPLGIHRGRAIRRLRRTELPASVPTLDELYARCGTDFPLALDMTDPSAAEAVVDTASRHGAMGNLWMTYWRTATVESWRARWPELRLVFPSLPLRRPEQFVSHLAAIGVDAANVHRHSVTPRLADAAHRHGLLLFAWGVRRRHSVAAVMARGADGVFADDVEALVAAVAARGALLQDNDRVRL
jgi:glycerophosphoryl diester phosphodiesterase